MEFYSGCSHGRVHCTMTVLGISFFVLTFVTECWGRRVTINLPDYRQSDHVGNQYHLAYKNDTKSCTRHCEEGDHRICYYEFVLENYAVLTRACGNCPENTEDCFLPQCVTADGHERGILTVNRKLPGPSIQVCYNDWIVVDVKNIMLARSISFHWHGIIQRNRGYMDGVPYINQCPILEDTEFRYVFRADHTGTNYWHAHSALHKLNGLQGSIIVRLPNELDPVSDLYHFDLPAHCLFIADWYHAEAESRLPGLIHQDATQETTFYLINGKGRYTMPNGTTTTTPYKVFNVKKGYKYRFRVVSAVCTQCAARIRIEEHRLCVIATDGVAVKPRCVDAMDIYSGERYDFVLEATREVRNYWIQVRGMGICFNKDVCQLAVLHYEGAGNELPTSPKPTLENFDHGGLLLNPPNATCGPGENGVCVTQLKSLLKVSEEILNPKEYLNIGILFDYYFPTVKEEFQSGTYVRYLQATPNTTLITQANGIQYTFPSSPLLTQYEDIPEDDICPFGEDGLPECPKHTKDFCSCTQIIRIPLNSIVQFVLIDKSAVGDLKHPFHIHGTTPNLIATGYVPEQFMTVKGINELLKSNEIPVSKNSVYKDTFAVPTRGFAVIRFKADNPGFWFFHCHFLFHHVTGMAVVLQIGEPSDFPKIPKGFPKCGNYVPPLAINYKRKHK